MSRYAIDIQGVSKHYPTFSLKDISLQLPMGSIMGFIGENGAGKTTTIKAMLGLVQKDSGTVQMLGRDMDHDALAAKQEIGVVFSDNHFHEILKLKEIEHILRHIYHNWDKQKFFKLCSDFGLDTEKTVKELSHGMQMKLSIAAALAHHPKLLVLDEATSGLDPVVREEILDLFYDFIQDEHHAILLSSHITSDLDKIADYITFIHNGEIVFSQNKDVMLEEHGILRCSRPDLAAIDPKYVVSWRKSEFSFEALIREKEAFINRYPELLVERATVEQIMLLTIRGTASRNAG